MRVCAILLSAFILMGCGGRSDPSPEKTATTDCVSQTQETAAGLGQSVTNSVIGTYAKGVVTRKNGKKVAGHILLQCPEYLTVCYKINSSEPGSSELVPIEEVQSVVLEGAMEDVDPIWQALQEEMIVLFDNAEEAATESVTGTITLDGRPVGNARVKFVPVDGGEGTTGITNARGEYELDLEVGVTPGSYEVRINPDQKLQPTGDETKKADIGEKSESTAF